MAVNEPTVLLAVRVYVVVVVGLTLTLGLEVTSPIPLSMLRLVAPLTGGKAKRPCRLAIAYAPGAAGGPSFVLKGWVVEKTVRAAGLGMGLARGPVVVCVAAMPGWVAGIRFSCKEL